jgi:tetratricopeptide (TPR) repeat protein
MSKVDAVKQQAIIKTGRELWVVLGLLCALGLFWGYRAWSADQNYRRAILSIELEMVNGRFGIAARELNRLLERYPDSAEAALLLGRCEKERGRVEAATEALSRVSPGSDLSHKAILARMRLRHDQGRFAAAEQLIEEAAADPRSDRAHVRVLLVPIFSQLGRLDEAQRLLEDWWQELNNAGEGASERAIDQVRMHVELAFKPNPVDNVRAYLDQAFQMAPDDDRVWLGRANLAIRTGDYTGARRWLDDCLKRRPDDVPVWSAMLGLGLANDRIDLVEQALAHLPADGSTPAQRLWLGAWLYSHRGDHKVEREALELLIALSPGDRSALDWLARLADLAGETAKAGAWRGRKVDIEKLRARYEKLFDRNQPIRDAEEMADLAERLGRTFEARGFLSVEVAADPARADLLRKLERQNVTPAPVALPGKTLAEVLGASTRKGGVVDVSPAH